MALRSQLELMNLIQFTVSQQHFQLTVNLTPYLGKIIETSIKSPNSTPTKYRSEQERFRSKPLFSELRKECKRKTRKQEQCKLIS